MPVRLQRRRTKGYRLPPDAVYVGRPTRWGNPFRVGVPYCGPTIRTVHDQTEAVAAFRAWLDLDTIDARVWDNTLIAAHVVLKASLARGELRGRDLVCWCRLDQPCHADVLLEVANAAAPS